MSSASLFVSSLTLPHALEKDAPLWSQLSQKRPALFLDYDGTLTPIVARPELAVLAPPMRALLQDLSEQIPVAVLSGRGREDVARLVDLPHLIYAGSHGMDICGPHLTKIAEGAAELLPAIQEAKGQLQNQLANFPGVLVEDKKFALAIHYRLAEESDLRSIEKSVDQTAAQFSQLKKTTGKKVFELRANIPWDKGKALLYLMKVLQLDLNSCFPLYLGDDDTDEDAFAVLQETGAGILVSEVNRQTQAKYYLRNVEEVQQFLKRVFIAVR